MIARRRFLRGLASAVGFAGVGALAGRAQAGTYFDIEANQWLTWGDDNEESRPVPEEFMKRTVQYATGEKTGNIIVSPQDKFLYFVLDAQTAIRYGIGVGRDGFGWHGTVFIGNKREWPDWTPPPQMIEREKLAGNILPPHMDGGEDNPLGARAMYLYRDGVDTLYRIHGTNQEWSIGTNVSSGCFRMMNADVTDLYDRAKIGARVTVL